MCEQPTTYELMASAIRYALDRTQREPEFYHVMVMTETHERLCRAEAEMLGQPFEEVLERRREPSGMPARLADQETTKKRLQHVEAVLERCEYRGMDQEGLVLRMKGALRWFPRRHPDTFRVFPVHGPALRVETGRGWTQLTGYCDPDPKDRRAPRYWTNGHIAVLLKCPPPRWARSGQREWSARAFDYASTPAAFTDGTYESGGVRYSAIGFGDQTAWVQETYAQVLRGAEIVCSAPEAPVVGYLGRLLVAVVMPVKAVEE